MVTWFAGLFYLPRLFVYHILSSDQPSRERFKIMERKLYMAITTPGMILTLGFGIWMLVDYAWELYGASRWLHTKLLLIFLLVVFHFWCGKWLMDLSEERNTHSHIFFRWMNEIPAIFLVVIIILATIKPT